MEGLFTLLAALFLLFIIQHVIAQANFNLDKVDFSSSTTFPSVRIPAPQPLPPPQPAPIPVPAPTTTSPSITQETANTAASNICATPLEFLQCRDNVGTFLSAMQAAGLTNFLTSRTAVQTLFVPSDAAFTALLQSQGLTSLSQIPQNTLILILQNHILPNEQVRVADMVLGASFPTINPNEQLTVVSPVAPAISNGDLRACNSLIQETNVVLVPTANPATKVATVPPQHGSSQMASPQQQQQQQQPQQQQPRQFTPSAPATFSSDLDITRINFGLNPNGRTSPFG